MDYTPTAIQLERGLTDPDLEVRCRFACRDDYTPTDIQFERGLSATHERVFGIWHEHLVASFARRADFRPTAKQLERGLTHQSAKIRSTFAARVDFHLTCEQVARGLLDESELVRFAIASRKSFIPTLIQFESGVLDPHPSISQLFYFRDSEWTKIRLSSLLSETVNLNFSKTPTSL